MKNHSDIPAYDIDVFSRGSLGLFQFERFDGHRKFDVRYPHTHHDFYEILYITKGTGTYTIDFEHYDIMPEILFLLLPGQVHEIEVSPDIEGFIFLFTQDFLNQIHTSHAFVLYLNLHTSINRGLEPWKLGTSDQGPIKILLSQIENEITLRKVDYQGAVRAYLELLLIHMRRHYGQSEWTTDVDKEKKLVYAFRNLVEQNLDKNLHIQSYAEMLHVSVNVLGEIVRKHTGKTCSEIMDQRTLIEVKRLLKYTDLTISEVADKLHFSDVSYFTKYVKKHSGYTPKHLRSQL